MAAILKNVVKMAEIRYIFQTLTCPKLLNKFKPNFTQLFSRVLATILSFQIFQNGRRLKRGTPKSHLNAHISKTVEPKLMKLGMIVETN